MQLDLRSKLCGLATEFDSKAIRAHFGAAAKHYDDFCSIQQLTANNLVELIPEDLKNNRNGVLLDLGCGTGSTLESYYRQYGGYCVGLDLTYRMLKEAGCLSGTLQGNMEQLPIRNQSIDLVVSNSACQWMMPALVVSEIERVLKPGSFVFLSLFVDGCLPELKQNQSLQRRVQKLSSEKQWLNVIQNSDLSIERSALLVHVQKFDNQIKLFNSIRGVGASISPEGHKYMGKEAYKNLLSDGAKGRQLSWRTFYLVLKKTSDDINFNTKK